MGTYCWDDCVCALVPNLPGWACRAGSGAGGRRGTSVGGYHRPPHPPHIWSLPAPNHRLPKHLPISRAHGTPAQADLSEPWPRSSSQTSAHLGPSRASSSPCPGSAASRLAGIQTGTAWDTAELSCPQASPAADLALPTANKTSAGEERGAGGNGELRVPASPDNPCRYQSPFLCKVSFHLPTRPEQQPSAVRDLAGSKARAPLRAYVWVDPALQANRGHADGMRSTTHYLEHLPEMEHPRIHPLPTGSSLQHGAVCSFQHIFQGSAEA